MDQELFSRVIANILQTEVRHLLNGAAGEELLADFEGKHCFSRELRGHDLVNDRPVWLAAQPLDVARHSWRNLVGDGHAVEHVTRLGDVPL